MIQRATDDRRTKKIKVEEDNRQTRRRKEDIANIRAYYGVLGLSIFTFVLIGLLSAMKGF